MLLAYMKLMRVNVSDYVRPSYAPTLNTLLVPVPLKAPPFSMLAVAQPKVSGAVPLPYTLKELERIEKYVPKEWLVKLDTPAIAEKVMPYLSAASVAHFACHGYQDITNPLNSAIVLGDGELTISTIMQARMTNASLVFLSACQTATGNEELPDEIIHIAATMLFACFCGAVATMWSAHSSIITQICCCIEQPILGLF
jgi:CHAT domain-containing protein